MAPLARLFDIGYVEGCAMVVHQACAMSLGHCGLNLRLLVELLCAAGVSVQLHACTTGVESRQ